MEDFAPYRKAKPYLTLPAYPRSLTVIQNNALRVTETCVIFFLFYWIAYIPIHTNLLGGKRPSSPAAFLFLRDGKAPSSYPFGFLSCYVFSSFLKFSSFLYLLQSSSVSIELHVQRSYMGLGCKLNTMMRLGLLPSLQSPFTANSSPSCCSSSFRSREAYVESTKLSFTHVILENSDMARKDSFRVYTCLSSALQMTEDNYTDVEIINKRKRKILPITVDNLPTTINGEKSIPKSGVHSYNKSHYQLLMKNVDALEQRIANSNSMELEKDILVQLRRLGALELFQRCLSRTVTDLPVLDNYCKVDQLSAGDNGQLEDCKLGQIVVRSKKKGKRRSKNKMTFETSEKIFLENVGTALMQPSVSSVTKKSKTSSAKLSIARKEAEMSCGVKVVANLESIRETLEKETGIEVGLSSWAEAAGIDEKVLQKRLHFGWCCRDELITSVQPLVLYLARTYRGLGIASEDLVQAGNMGVLRGALRFDHTRGYKFSTYVQYWIRKAMSKYVSRHARGIRIPATVSSAISSIQKARKVLQTSSGRCPDNIELAKFTGLSLARIHSVSKCYRVVGSTDQKPFDWSKNFLESTRDATVDSPERMVMKKHMKQDIMKLLNDLEPKEKRVLILRYGFGGHQNKSLQEVGKQFNVSKEWIRRVEKKALAKLRDQETQRCLMHYINM